MGRRAVRCAAPVSQRPNPLNAIRLWWRLIGFVRPWRGRVALGIVAAVVSALAAAGWAALLGPLLDSVLKAGEVGGVGPWELVGLAVLKALSSWLNTGLMTSAAQRALGSIRRALYSRLLELPPKWFEARHSGELLSRFTSDVGQVEFAVGQSLSSWAKDSFQVLALMGVCLAADPRLFLLTFVVIPGMVIPVTRFAKSARAAAKRSQASLGVLSQMASEQLANLPVVQAFQLEPASMRAFDEEQGRYLAVMKRSLFIRGAFTPTTELIGMLGAAAALTVGARAVLAEPVLASKLIQFLAAALFMYQPMKSLAGTFSQSMQGLGAAARLFEVLDAPTEPDAGVKAETLESLRCEGLKVVYPDGREALRGVTFEVPKGKHVALVGPSGAGKSSVVSALLGFVQPSGGAVLWNGRPLNELSRRSVRDQMAWVPQEPVLLSGSVRDNLRVGREDASEQAMWQALSRAHAADFVKAWPRGLDEDVGERGARLSGGQRQRLAIARAFLKAPSLLVLDEPTSGLDAATEVEVQAGLAELMGGQTTLVIAHRLATIRQADLIVVMENGAVVETGTHESLLAQNGVYARLIVSLAPRENSAPCL